MFTHRLYLHDGLSLMTKEDRAALDKIKQDVQQSAAEAAGSAASAQEYSVSIDPDRINANVALKADNLYFDPDTSMLYLTSNGEIIGDGVTVSTTGGSGGNVNNAVLSLRNTTGWSFKNVSQSSTCKLSFTWSSLEDGISTGAGAVTVKVGGVLRYSSTVEQGDVEIDVSSYLSTGSNAVRVSVSDIYGNSRTIAFTINMITLTLTSSFDATVAYTGSITFPYVPTGAVEKTVRFILDGVEIGHAVTSVSGRQQSFVIPAQKHGSHTLLVYFESVIDGETVRSNGLYYDIICLESGNNTPVIVSSFRDTDAEQYVTFAIPYAVYNPQSLTSTVVLKANGLDVSTQTVDRTTQTWSYRPDTDGELKLSIECAGANGVVVKKEFKITVKETDITADAETENLALYLSAHGRSNNEAEPGNWSSGNIACEFSNFNFKTDGWHVDEDGATVLRVAGDARLTIPYKMFANDFRTTGKTLEIEFATRDVLNYDAVIMSCMSGGRGLQLTTQKATLISESSSIGTQYKEEEHVRLSFVVEKKSGSKLLLCYINGILSGSVKYPDDDDFAQATPVNISIGHNDCTTDIYCIRVYDNDLTRYQILDNWIADTQVGVERKARFERNNVYDDYGIVTTDTLKKDLPYLVVVCPVLPAYKDDVKTCSGYYVDPVDNTKSFTFENAEIDVQGTSSQYYYVKNFKIKFKGGFTLYDGNYAEKYQLNDKVVPTSTYTFKADVASSEGANNVVLAQIYNELCPVKTPPQRENHRVRQTIDGHPIALFWDNGSETKFYGKMNFNHDKGTAEVFGFSEGDESWEILQNGTELTGFRSADFSGTAWKTDFEARYPKDNVNIANLAAFAEWVVSTNADAATNEALPRAVTYDGIEYTTDSEEYRLAKFKMELKDRANVDALVFYYVITELFLCIDQREKNAFPTLWEDDPHWMMLFYDADSSLGIDNKGKLSFDYYLEDIDYTEAGDPIYNGQASTLWVNLRKCFYAEIEAEYKRLRTTIRSDGSGNPLLSYDVVNDLFEAHQGKWSEAIFNEDGYRKSIDPYVLNGDESYLPMLQGKKEQQRKWWLYNRFRYLDSKYNTGSSMTNRIIIRAHAQANIKLVAYTNMYGHVYYNAEMAEHRMVRGQEYEFEWAATGAEDTVIGINDADMLTSLSDLSQLMVETIDISKAIHLSYLKVGDAAEGYNNRNLKSITLGNNVLLKTIDFRNCSALTQSVDASGCTGLEEVYFDGTAITGLSLPNGGNLKTLHLPSTVTNLTLKNQTALTEFVMPGYSNVSTLWLENNSSVIDPLAIFNNMPAGSRVRMIGFNMTAENYSDISNLIAKFDSMRGLDENGNNTEYAQISGTIYIDQLTQPQLNAIAEAQVRYPSLTVLFNSIETYTVNFYDYDDTLLYTVENVAWGTAVEFVGDTPVRPNTSANEDWEFIGWDPDPTFVTENLDCYAQYKNNVAKTRLLLNKSISGSVENDVVTSIGGTAFANCTALTDVSFPNVTLLGHGAFLNCSGLTDVDFPSITSISESAFSGCSKLSKIAIPASVTTIYKDAFKNCNAIVDVYITDLEAWCNISMPYYTSNPLQYGANLYLNGALITNVEMLDSKLIASYVFNGYTSLTRMIAPNVSDVGTAAFNGCTSLSHVDFTAIGKILNNAFTGCTNLNVLILRAETIPWLTNSNAFTNTPIASGTGYIYVPSTLVSSYKTASNWSIYANQFRAIEDYPDICGEVSA